MTDIDKGTAGDCFRTFTFIRPAGSRVTFEPGKDGKFWVLHVNAPRLCGIPEINERVLLNADAWKAVCREILSVLEDERG